MTNANSTTEPRALFGAIVGACSAVWVASSAPENARVQVALLILAGLGVTVILAKRSSWCSTVTFGLAALALVLGAIHHFAIQQALNVRIVHHVCVPNEADFAVVFALVALPVLTLGGAAVFALGRFLAQHARLVAPLLRLASLAAFAGAFALLAWAIPEMSRKPAPDRYVESLPVFAVLPPITGEPSHVVEEKERILYPSVYYGERKIYTTQVYDFPLPGDLVTQRYCPSFREDCALVIRQADSVSVSKGPDLTRPGVGTETDDCRFKHFYVDKNASIVLRADIAHGVLVADGTVRYALDNTDLGSRVIPRALNSVYPPYPNVWTTPRSAWGLQIRDVIDATSSPRGWIAVACTGLFVAALLEALRFRARRRIARIAKAPAGVLNTAGWLTLDDGSTPLHIGGDAAIRSGSVVVLSVEVQKNSYGPYRGDKRLQKLEVLHGERAEVLHRERWGAQSSIDALVFAVLLLSATPLATFWQG